MKTKRLSRILGTFLALCMMLSMLPSVAYAAVTGNQWVTGSGTAEDPYLVSAWAGLGDCLSDVPPEDAADPTIYIKLATDLDVPNAGDITVMRHSYQLDLAGHNINAGTTANQLFNIRNFGELTITNSSNSSSSLINTSSAYQTFSVKEQAKLHFSLNPSDTIYSYSRRLIYTDSGPYGTYSTYISMNGGCYGLMNANTAEYLISVSNKATVDIYNSSLYSAASTNYAMIDNAGLVTLHPSSGKITMERDNAGSFVSNGNLNVDTSFPVRYYMDNVQFTPTDDPIIHSVSVGKTITLLSEQEIGSTYGAWYGGNSHIYFRPEPENTTGWTQEGLPNVLVYDENKPLYIYIFDLNRSESVYDTVVKPSDEMKGTLKKNGALFDFDFWFAEDGHEYSVFFMQEGTSGANNTVWTCSFTYDLQAAMEATGDKKLYRADVSLRGPDTGNPELRLSAGHTIGEYTLILEGIRPFGYTSYLNGDYYIYDQAWYLNNKLVQGSDIIQSYKSYTLAVTLRSNTAWYFSSDSRISLNQGGSSFAPTYVSTDGKLAQFRLTLVSDCDHSSNTSREWSHNYSGHWRVCSICKQKIEEEEHGIISRWDGATKINECTVCDFIEELTGERTPVRYFALSEPSFTYGDVIPSELETNSDNYYSTNIVWKKDGMEIVPAGSTFESGHSYTATVTLKCSEAAIIDAGDENYPTQMVWEYILNRYCEPVGAIVIDVVNNTVTQTFEVVIYERIQQATLTLPILHVGDKIVDVLDSMVNCVEYRFGNSISENTQFTIDLTCVVNGKTEIVGTAGYANGEWYSFDWTTAEDDQSGLIESEPIYHLLIESLHTGYNLDESRLTVINEEFSDSGVAVDKREGLTQFHAYYIFGNGGTHTVAFKNHALVTYTGPSSITAGEAFSFTLNVAEGYYLQNVDIRMGSWLLQNGKHFTVDPATGNVTVNVPINYDVSITAEAISGELIIPKPVNPFVDVAESDWYYNAVLWAVNNKITAGMDDTHFGPNGICTRAQAVTFLWNNAGKPTPGITESPFSDVKPGDWYYNAVLWALEQGITAGMGDGTFGANQNCTRAQIVQFLYNADGKPAYSTTTSPFTDVKTDDWYYDAVLWAVEHEITAGMGDGTFGFNNHCTRAQIVQFLYNAAGKPSV